LRQLQPILQPATSTTMPVTSLQRRDPRDPGRVARALFTIGPGFALARAGLLTEFQPASCVSNPVISTPSPFSGRLSGPGMCRPPFLALLRQGHHESSPLATAGLALALVLAASTEPVVQAARIRFGACLAG